MQNVIQLSEAAAHELSCAQRKKTTTKTILFIATANSRIMGIMQSIHDVILTYLQGPCRYVSRPGTFRPATTVRRNLLHGQMFLFQFIVHSNLSHMGLCTVAQAPCDNMSSGHECVLQVLLDCELTLKQHVNRITTTCFYHLRRLRQIKRHVDVRVMKQLISAFIFSRLDYCNVILSGLPLSTIAALQRVQNAAARTDGVVAA